MAHIDDYYLQSQTYEQCVGNVIDTIVLFDSLGWVIHPRKSILTPTQKLVTLGFMINSISMAIRLTADKANDLKQACGRLLKSYRPLTMTKVASVIGKIVASFPGVTYGPLYYRDLEKTKSSALKVASGDFEEKMPLPPLAKRNYSGVSTMLKLLLSR